MPRAGLWIRSSSSRHDMRMKILHSAALLSPPPGILNQMRDELMAAKTLSVPWNVVMFMPADASEGVIQASKWVRFRHTSILPRMLAWLLLRIEYHLWLLAQSGLYDAFVLRYYVHDPFQLLFLLLSRRPVFLVHHTLEVPELMMQGGMLSNLRGRLERLLGGLAIRHCAGTIGVTREIIDHEIMRAGPVQRTGVLYPNGIYSGTDVLQDQRREVPELIFVAGFFASWHGLDILLRACADSHEEFIIHVIGELQSEDLRLAQLDSRIVLHGKLSQAQIKTLSARCWLGLSSFALERKSMHEACTLKVREYLSSGLAVYAGHVDVFPHDAKFFRYGGVDMSTILAYAHETKPLARQEVAAMAAPYIDKMVLLDKLYADIQHLMTEHEDGAKS